MNDENVLEEISIEDENNNKDTDKVEVSQKEDNVNKEIEAYYNVFLFLQQHGFLTTFSTEDENIDYFYKVYDHLKERRGIVLKDITVLPVPVDTRNLAFVNGMYKDNDLMEWKRKRQNEKEDKIYYINGLLRAVRGLFQEFKNIPGLIRKYGFKVLDKMKNRMIELLNE